MKLLTSSTPVARDHESLGINKVRAAAISHIKFLHGLSL